MGIELGEVVTSLGDGGMIHQFKTYVLRKDAARIDKIVAAMERAKLDIALYQALPNSEIEIAALQILSKTLLGYELGLEQAQEEVAAGLSMTATDALAKRTEAQAASLQESSSAATELSASVDSVATQAGAPGT